MWVIARLFDFEGAVVAQISWICLMSSRLTPMILREVVMVIVYAATR